MEGGGGGFLPRPGENIDTCSADTEGEINDW